MRVPTLVLVIALTAGCASQPAAPTAPALLLWPPLRSQLPLPPRTRRATLMATATVLSGYKRENPQWRDRLLQESRANRFELRDRDVHDGR